MSELTRRRIWTLGRLDQLRQRLDVAAGLAKDKACVYVTGSFGRGEASELSDLDLFILGKTNNDRAANKKAESLLSRLDEICIKAELMRLTLDLRMPQFSGDGEYLVHYSLHKLTKTLGRPSDDFDNTFTARLLLLLESKPLIGEDVYWDAINGVIKEYWRDYEDHSEQFMPAFIANDILRLWRTFCVNYEAKTERTPDGEKAKGKLKNYKLKHSRMLTCYSALLEILVIYGRIGTVAPADMLNVASRTPTQRLEWLLQQDDLAGIHDNVKKLLEQYQRFLEITSSEEDEIVNMFKDKETGSKLMSEAYNFGDTMFDVLAEIQNGGRFYRLLIV